MSKTIFDRKGKESAKSRLIRLSFNFFPAYRRTGGHVCFIADDWKDIHVKISLNWKTRNYVGTVFGGSIFGALDPFYMIQLINILGEEYVVWDKSANVQFIKPISKTVYARFLIADELIEDIISKIKSDKKYIITLPVDFQDQHGTVYAKVDKVIYIADKNYYKNRSK